ACNNGASKAVERSRQCCSLVVPFAADPPAAIARAINSAPSHVEAAGTGDQHNRRIPLGHTSRSPDGSYNQTCPTSARARHVASITSGLVAVETTGPAAASTEGITIEPVFPDRGGPNTMTACSGSAVTHRPPGPSPRYAPPPSRADLARTAAAST